MLPTGMHRLTNVTPSKALGSQSSASPTSPSTSLQDAVSTYFLASRHEFAFLDNEICWGPVSLQSEELESSKASQTHSLDMPYACTVLTCPIMACLQAPAG